MYNILRTGKGLIAVILSFAAPFMLMQSIFNKNTVREMQIYEDRNKPIYEDKSFEAISSRRDRNAHADNALPRAAVSSKQDANERQKTLANDTEPNFDWWSSRLARKEKMLGRQLYYAENCRKVLPQAIVIGVMKCGTEALTTFLAVHPDIALQLRVEAVLFFNNHYEEGLEWYRDQMACSTENQITMEKSPQYFSAPIAPQRIHDMNSSIKLIMIVREPISRAVSHYTHVKSVKPGRVSGSFEKTVMGPRGEINAHSEFLVKSMYSVHLKRWLSYFSLDQIHVVDGDNYKDNPAEELQKIEGFLGVRNYITRDIFQYNSQKGFFCLKGLDGQEHCMPAGKGRTHPNVRPDVLTKLQAFFKPYNGEFFRMIGRTFDWDY